MSGGFTGWFVLRPGERGVDGKQTFAAYCWECFAYKPAYSYQMIKAAKVIRILARNNKMSAMADILPENERQVRPLTRLAGKDLIPAWNEVLELAGGRPVTAELVRAVVEKYLNPGSKVSKAGAKLRKLAKVWDEFCAELGEDLNALGLVSAAEGLVGRWPGILAAEKRRLGSNQGACI